MRDTLLTLAETADYLGCSRATVKRWIAAGTLPTFRNGRVVRVRELELERFVAMHTTRHTSDASTAAAGVILEPGARLWD